MVPPFNYSCRIRYTSNYLDNDLGLCIKESLNGRSLWSGVGRLPDKVRQAVRSGTGKSLCKKLPLRPCPGAGRLASAAHRMSASTPSALSPTTLEDHSGRRLPSSPCGQRPLSTPTVAPGVAAKGSRIQQDVLKKSAGTLWPRGCPRYPDLQPSARNAPDLRRKAGLDCRAYQQPKFRRCLPSVPFVRGCEPSRQNPGQASSPSQKMAVLEGEDGHRQHGINYVLIGAASSRTTPCPILSYLVTFVL